MKRDLTIYFSSSLQMDLFPVDGKELVDYWDRLQESRMALLMQEVNELSEAGCYDRI